MGGSLEAARATPQERDPGRKYNQICKRTERRCCMLLFVVAFCVGVTWVSSSSLDGVLQSEDVRYFIPYSSIRGASQSVTAVVDNHDQYGFKPFVRYWLEYDKPYSLVYANATGQCKIGLTHNKWGRKPILREGLDKSLSKILDVTTYLQTNLKIITVGDSVAMQFHQVLEEALEPPPKPRTIGDVGLGIGNQTTYRTLYQSAWEGHESVSVSAPVNGGGALAAFRMTGLLLTEGRGKPPPNAGPDLATAAGGWLPQHVQQILDHKYTAVVSGNDNGVASSTDSFDVMIFRIPHGWLPASLVTRERLEKSLSLARDLFGVRTVIIQTLTLNNNVKTVEDLDDMRKANRMIHELVEASWGSSDLPDLLLMDFGRWTDQLTELNARLAGMNTTDNSQYVLERLGTTVWKYPPSIAQICVDKNVAPGTPKCIRNMMSIDGMHWCMETLGGRIVGGISCLLQCSLLIDGMDASTDKSLERKRLLLGSCQERCNDQYMSMREASSLATNITASLE